MFWHSVQQGLIVLLHWQTYFAILEFLVILMLPRVVIGLILKRQPLIMATGCVLPFIMVLFQTLAVIVFALTMSPMILGRSNGAAWFFPWLFMTTFPAAFVKLILVANFVGLFLSIIKLDLFANALVGCYILTFVASVIANQFGLAEPHLWPGLWFMVGILIVSGVLFYIGILLTGGLPALFGENAAAVGQLVAFPIGAVLMFLPMFIYGGWLIDQIGK